MCVSVCVIGQRREKKRKDTVWEVDAVVAGTSVKGDRSITCDERSSVDICMRRGYN